MSVQITDEIRFELEKRLAGEVNTDMVSRVLFSTDASNYQILPLAVVFPKVQDDLEAVMEVVAQHRLPLLPRGSGSSLAGQTVGAAVVVDFSRYLDKVEQVDAEEKTAWVQPGVVLSNLNRALNAYDLQFGPDPASADRATMGGIFGNNATGSHSIVYGMASDHLLDVDVILADGEIDRFSSLPLEQAQHRANQAGLSGNIYRTALDIRENRQELIRAHWPKTWRNCSGYALNYLVPWTNSQPPGWQLGVYLPVSPGELDMAKLMVGSEGTLAMFTRFKIGLVDKVRHKVLVVLPFDDIISASEATPGILETGPSAVELVPKAILEKARTVPAYAAKIAFLEGSPEAVLLVEYAGDSMAEVRAKAAVLSGMGLLLEDEQLQKQLWEVRKVGLGLIMLVKGDAKPIPFIEDLTVPVESLGAFVREFKQVLADYGTRGDFYAHASAGCLHIRPIVNLKSEAGVSAMREIAGEMVKVTLKYGGALSGEHGDGLSRGEWLDEIYGQEIVSLFQQLKQAADPENLLNPGKVAQAGPMVNDLRFGADYAVKPWETVQGFDAMGGLAGAIEMCNGAGVCRQSSGAMCPTFQATRDEMHSTRGRSNLLREYIAGKYLDTQSAEQAAYEALQLCLACKGCKAECPSSVDVAKLKYEFMHHYYQNHKRPVSDYLFGYIGRFARLGRPFGWIANHLFRAEWFKRAMENGLGISAKRTMPQFHSRARIAQTPKVQTGEDVILLSDPYSEYFSTELLAAAGKVLTGAGCKVHLLSNVGAGRTMLSKGFIPAAKKHGEKLLAEIKKIDPEGRMTLVGIEPSEIAMITDDLLGLVSDPYLEALAKRCFSVEEFLLRTNAAGMPRYQALDIHAEGLEILLHGHCYQKAQKPKDDSLPFGVGATVAVLEHLGCVVEVVQSGCCGMAGAFGYEVDHYETSQQVAEMFLLPAIRNKQEHQVVAASGASCRAQIEDGTQEIPLHPVRILANLLDF